MAIKGVDVAIDFFNGLDNGRYSSFKAELSTDLPQAQSSNPKI